MKRSEMEAGASVNWPAMGWTGKIIETNHVVRVRWGNERTGTFSFAAAQRDLVLTAPASFTTQGTLPAMSEV